MVRLGPCVALRVLAVLVLTQEAAGHGYVLHPASRTALCSNRVPQRLNLDCGDRARFCPHCVENLDGQWPSSSAGELLAGGMLEQYRAITEQAPTRWAKTGIKAGLNYFTWVQTAPHRTKDWRYFITKEGWDANRALDGNSLEAEPFCVVYGGYVGHEMSAHECNVPTREGYHVILSIWDVGDTAKSFYQVIDVDIAAGETCSDLEAEYNACMSGVPVPPPAVTPQPQPQPAGVTVLQGNPQDATPPAACRAGWQKPWSTCRGDLAPCCEPGLACTSGTCRWP